MLKNLNTSRLRGSEFIQFLQAFLAIINGSTVAKAAVLAPYNALNAIVQQLNDLFVNDPASALTKVIADLDAGRDGLITGLGLLCHAFTYHPDAATRGAAETLERSLKIYGLDIAGQEYNAETTIVENILTDWTTKPELIAGAALLNAGAWTSALATANVAFKTKYAERTTNIAAQNLAAPESLTEKRAEANTAYKALVRKVDANWDIADGASPWDIVVSQLNALIDQYDAVIRNRAGHAAAHHADGSTPAA